MSSGSYISISSQTKEARTISLQYKHTALHVDNDMKALSMYTDSGQLLRKLSIVQVMFKKVSMTRPRGYTTFFMLNSNEP